MKTMTLCAISFALLLFLIARGLFAGNPIIAYVSIFCAACLWALLMWGEKYEHTPPDSDGKA